MFIEYRLSRHLVIPVQLKLQDHFVFKIRNIRNRFGLVSLPFKEVREEGRAYSRKYGI